MEPASNPPVLGGTLPADRIFIVFVFLGFKLILSGFTHFIVSVDKSIISGVEPIYFFQVFSNIASALVLCFIRLYRRTPSRALRGQTSLIFCLAMLSSLLFAWSLKGILSAPFVFSIISVFFDIFSAFLYADPVSWPYSPASDIRWLVQYSDRFDPNGANSEGQDNWPSDDDDEDEDDENCYCMWGPDIEVGINIAQAA